MSMLALSQRVEVLEKQMAQLIAESQSDKKKEEKKEKKEKKDKKQKKEKNSSDDDEPKKKRALTGYNLYCKAMRDEAKTQLADDSDEPPKSQDIMKKIGAMWKALDEEETQEWNDKAKELKEADA